MTNTALNRALQSKPSSFPPGALRLAGVLPTGMVWVTSAMQVALTHPPCCRRCLGEEGSRKADYCCLKVICGHPLHPGAPQRSFSKCTSWTRTRGCCTGSVLNVISLAAAGTQEEIFGEVHLLGAGTKRDACLTWESFHHGCLWPASVPELSSSMVTPSHLPFTWLSSSFVARM